MMDHNRVKLASENIEECERALRWLLKYGTELKNGIMNGEFSMAFTPRYAAGCDGAICASSKIANWAKFSIEKIVKDAIEDCRNTIEIEKTAIMAELDKEP